MVFGLLLLPLCARAGSYGPPVYSGGATTATGPTDNTPGPYTLASAPNSSVPSGSAYGGSAYNHQFFYPQSVTINCQGAITATFTWDGGPNNDPAPAANSVIVVEQVVANWGGQSGGVGGDISGTTTGTSANQTYTGTRYSVQGGSSISVTCTPTASASSTAPANGGVGATANVGYTATAYPVTLTSVGTTLDSSHSYNILVGQGCKASLVGIPDALLNNTDHKPTYSWTVSGTTFQSWTVTQDLTANPPTSSTQFTPGYGDPAQPMPHWYWNDPGPNPTDETVSCTVTLTPPAGQGAGFPVTVTQKVTVQVPAWTAYGIGGYIQVNSGSLDITGLAFWAGPFSPLGNNDAHYGGMDWTATCATPQKPVAFGTGTLELVQIVTPNRSYTTNTVPPVVHPDTETSQGLDSRYPYNELVGPFPYVEGGHPYATYDDPGMSLDNDLVGSASMAESFNDYLLYQPPGTDIRWVPLANFTWTTNTTNGSITIPKGGNIIPASGNWANYSVSGTPSDKAGTVSAGAANPFTNPPAKISFKPWNTHPKWTLINVFPKF